MNADDTLDVFADEVRPSTRELRDQLSDLGKRVRVRNLPSQPKGNDTSAVANLKHHRTSNLNTACRWLSVSLGGIRLILRVS
jgi:hypothetical protein